jgi:hypothetical protein
VEVQGNIAVAQVANVVVVVEVEVADMGIEVGEEDIGEDSNLVASAEVAEVEEDALMLHHLGEVECSIPSVLELFFSISQGLESSVLPLVT